MLKYSILLTDQILDCKFSDTHSLRFFVIFESGSFQTYDFKMEYQSSLTNNNFRSDNGTVAVMNGRDVKLTPLGVCNMPPPFALKIIKISEKFGASFNCNWWKNYLFIVGVNGFMVIHNDLESNNFEIIFEHENKLFDNRVKYFTFSADLNRKLGYIILVKYVHDSVQDELVKLDFVIEYTDNKLVLKNNTNTSTLEINLCSGIFNSCVSDQLMDLDFLTKLVLTGAKEEVKDPKKKDKNAKTDRKKGKQSDLFSDLMFQRNDSDDEQNDQDDIENNESKDINKIVYLIQAEDNNTKEKQISSLHLNPDENISKNDIKQAILKNIPFDINKAKSTFFAAEEHLVYLTKNNRLFLDNFLLALDVTSFEIFNKFLFFTQLSNTPYHTLHIIDFSLPLPSGLSKNEALYTPNFTTKNFNLRTIERGSLIVTLYKINLVFQMSIRGNLETCQPRLIVLNEACRLIKEHKYIQAYEMIRKNKINLNFLYDVDPEGFFKNVEEILKQIHKVITAF